MNEKKTVNRANSKVNHKLELSDKDFKAVILKKLQQAIKNSLEANKLKKNLI